MKRIVMALFFGMMVALVGCDAATKDPKGNPKEGDERAANKLVGSWEGEIPELKGLKLKMTFAADGKCTRETAVEGLPKNDNVKVDGGKQEGTYTHEGNTLTMKFGDKESKVTVKELTDSKMVLEKEGEPSITFTKK